MAHEGYPGHLYQQVYFSNVEAHEPEKMFSAICYTEGWATYVESVIARDSAASFMLNQNSKINMAIFALSDIGVNYEEWDKAKLTEFLSVYYEESSAPNLAEWIYETVVNNPGSYFPYIFGCTEIERLRDEAKSRLGDSFDLKAFHKALLELGPVPFSIADKYMKEML